MAKKDLAARFASIFSSPAAMSSLASLRGHVRLSTFNLATTSLRHLDKWYDRLEDIEAKRFGPHGNFTSDPAAVGLVSGAAPNAKLTSAGKEFYRTKRVGYRNPECAEYELLKTLYFNGHRHSARVEAFLARRKLNLIGCLSTCSPTPSRHLLLDHPRLLTIGEYVWAFEGAMLKYLSLSESDLEELQDLGESGFISLGASDSPPGFARICRKIGSDYTRADERRLNMLVAMALLEIRNEIVVSGAHFAPLRVPYPYCNLLSEADVHRMASDYTDDFAVVSDRMGFTVVMREIVKPREAKPHVGKIKLRMKRKARAKASKTVPTGKVRSHSGRDCIIIDTALGKMGEDYLQESLLSKQYGNRLIRIGHTDLETFPMNDGSVPGADFVVGTWEKPKAFLEVKASQSAVVNSVRLTAAEYARACSCHGLGVPYHLYVVKYVDPKKRPGISCDKNFASLVSSLRIDQLSGIDIPISLV